MTYLLDTHTWIYSVLEPARLSPAADVALREADDELLLSPISVWEALLLGQKGRIELQPTPLSWVRAALAATPASMVPVTHAIALASRELPGFPNDDPADRFLAATALVHDLILVTRDRNLRDYPRLRTLW